MVAGHLVFKAFTLQRLKIRCEFDIVADFFHEIPEMGSNLIMAYIQLDNVVHAFRECSTERACTVSFGFQPECRWMSSKMDDFKSNAYFANVTRFDQFSASFQGLVLLPSLIQLSSLDLNLSFVISSVHILLSSLPVIIAVA